MHLKATSFPLLVVLLVWSLVLGSARATALQEPAPKLLRIEWGYFPESLDPQQSDFGQGQLTGLAFEGLTRQDEEMAIVPAAAESWEFSEDGKTFTFHLREGLRYSDGTPLTAERFRYAVERQCDPRNAFFDAEALYGIVGCEAWHTSLDGATAPSEEVVNEAAKDTLGVRTLDDRTLEIQLVRPTPYFPAIATGSGFWPVKQELVEAGGPEWWRDPANWVSNGPFHLVAIDQGEDAASLRLARNEHYWGGLAKLDGIEYVIVDDSLEHYKAGDLDILFPTSTLVQEWEADPVLSGEIVSVPAAYGGVFLLNNAREPFNDKKVREGFAYAFDRDAYCLDLESGTCTPTLSWIPLGVSGSIETEAYAFDPEKARQALAESSYGGPENLPEIDWFGTPQEDPWFARRDQWVIDQFREVLGVEMVLTMVSDEEMDAFYDEAGSERPQMLSAFYFSSLPDPHDWLGMWTCGSDSIAEGIGYCNPEYDELVTRMNSELDPAKRLRLAEAAGQLLVADAPSIFVYNPTSVWLVKPYVTGYSRVAPNQQWPGWWNPLALDIVRDE